MFLAELAVTVLPAPSMFIAGIPGMLLERALWMVAYSAAIVAYDWILLPAFGTTPGKALFGMTVLTPEGLRLSSQAARVRSQTLLGRGLWFMLAFPYLQVLSVYQLSKQPALPWDFISRGVVYQRPVHFGRQNLGIAVAVVLALWMAGTQRVLKDQAHDELRQEVLGNR
jgi:uncharacterized RDD family membrane protein YckC